MSKTRLLPLAMYTTTMGMELCCLYLGLALLREHLGLGYFAFTLILTLYPLSLIFKLTMTKSPGTSMRSLVSTTIVAIAIVSAIVGVAIWQILVAGYPAGGVVLQIVFCGLAWWLGNSLVRDEISYYRTCDRFQIGILALLLLGAIEGETFLPVVFFFIMAVLALAMTRWQSSASGSTGILRASQSWSFLLSSLAVLLPSTAIFLALSPNVARAILNWLSAAGGNIVRFLGLDRLPSPAGKPIEFNFSCSFKPTDEGMELPPPPPPSAGTPTEMSPVVLWFVIFVAFIGLLVLILLTVRKVKAQRQARSSEMTRVETTPIRISPFGGLAAFIKGISRRLWHLLLSMLKQRRVTRFRLALTDEPAMSVRGLYRTLLHWAVRQGLPRAQSQTALEYLKVLCQKFPQEGKELAVITDIYVHARYSRGPINTEEFEAVREAWQKIKLHLKRLFRNSSKETFS